MIHQDINVEFKSLICPSQQIKDFGGDIESCYLDSQPREMDMDFNFIQHAVVTLIVLNP